MKRLLSIVVVLLFVAARPAGAAIALVQGWVTSADAAGGTSTTITFASNVTVGNLLVVVVRNGFTSAVDTTFTLSGGGNTYVEAIRTPTGLGGGSGTQFTAHIFYAKVVTGGFATITVTGANAGFFTADGAEFSGADPTTPLDTTGHDEQTNTSPDSGSVTSSAAGLVVAAVVDSQNNATYTQTGTGWTDIALTGGRGASAYRLSAASTYSDTWTFATNAGWFGVVAAFKQASATGAPTRMLLGVGGATVPQSGAVR